MSELGGMTVNERLCKKNLVREWDAAISNQDREAMIVLLEQVELADQADQIADAVLKRQI